LAGTKFTVLPEAVPVRFKAPSLPFEPLLKVWAWAARARARTAMNLNSGFELGFIGI
jgi:hypothetical protein